MKKGTLYSFILLFTFLVFRTQTTTKTYSFIQYQDNKIYFGSDSSDFLKLYQKMADIKGGDVKKVTIAHIGGSHVQAGQWSNAFYETLQSSFNVQGGGYFAFPYKMAKTNGQPYMKSFGVGEWKKCRCVRKGFCLPLGMNGISVSTNDSASYFGFSLTKYAACRKFNVVKVYHEYNCSFELESLMKAEKEEFKEEGYTKFTFDGLIDTVSFSLLKMDTMQKDFTLFGYSIEDNTCSGFYLAGLGSNGAATESFLRCNLFTDQLKTIKPDLVIFSIGVNDVQGKYFSKEDYILHYDSLIANVKAANPDCAILLTTATDNYIRRKTPNKKSDAAEEAMFDLMNKHNLAVWDMYHIMGGYKSIYKWYKAGLAARDKVHFNTRGYKILGNMMFDALYRSYLYNQNLISK